MKGRPAIAEDQIRGRYSNPSISIGVPESIVGFLLELHALRIDLSCVGKALIIKHIAYATNRSYWVAFSLALKCVTYTFNVSIYCYTFYIGICIPNVI